MVRGINFSLREEEIIQDNYDKTTYEIELLLLKEGYKRSVKSISRKLEKLREENKVGFRSKETKWRSYKTRTNRRKVEDKDLNDFDTGGSSFDNGEGKIKDSSSDDGFDNGEGDWDSNELE